MRWRCKVVLVLKPKIVIILFFLCSLLHHFQIFESGQIKFTSKIQSVRWGILCILTELIKSFYSSTWIDCGEVMVPVRHTILFLSLATLTHLPSKLWCLFLQLPLPILISDYLHRVLISLCLVFLYSVFNWIVIL